MAVMCLLLPMAAAHAAPTRVGIAAIVGEDVITTTDLAERRDLMMAVSGIPPTPENQTKITPRILESLIDETLQLQEAKRQSLTITDAEVSQAIGALSATVPQSKTTLQELVRARGLSQRSLEQQFRAQLAWGRVVQRKLRRNVSISQDEVSRAQLAEATAPGATELQLASLTLPITSPQEADAVNAQAKAIAARLAKGDTFKQIATQESARGKTVLGAPGWVAEETLPPMMQQTLRELKPGEVTPPLNIGNAIQFVQVLERRENQKWIENTEVILKQIRIPVPTKRTKPLLEKLAMTVEMLRSNPGSCEAATLPTTEFPASVKFVQTKLSAINPEQRKIIAAMNVGDISAPMPGPDAVRLVMLCEKSEPAAGNLPDAEEIRQKLFAEKLELEAQKALRNLRRDTFIDVKAAP